MSAFIRRMAAALLTASIAFAAGCAAPPASTSQSDPSAAAVAPATDAPSGTARNNPVAPAQSVPAPGLSAPRKPAPPMSDPLPAQRVADPAPAPGASPDVAVDRSCRTSADCAVKDVGSCCGYRPACVNVNSRPDPEAVKAECASSGMSSICGFQDISRCECVKGVCEAAGSAIR